MSKNGENANKVSAKSKLIETILRLNKSQKYDLNYIKQNIIGKPALKSHIYIKNNWVALKKDHPISMYIHIPYCKQRCDYCREESKKINGSVNLQKYVKCLISEFDLYSDIFENQELSSLYIGGGSPDLLENQALSKLLSSISNKFNFKSKAQKTFEFHPTGITKEKLNTIKKHGINRISFGVQTFNELALNKVNRIKVLPNKISEIIKHAKKLDFNEINVDLIYGLTGDKSETFIDSFNRICEMQPTNIYVYPVDPTKHYLNKFYNKNYSDFRNDLEEFNRSIISEIKSLSEEFGYRTSSSFKTENKRGFVFRNKKSDLIPYCFSAQYPNSCLGFGLYSYSRILGRLEYRELGYDKYPKYSVQQTGKEFEMFFNIQKNTTVNKIKFDNFNKYFKCDFLDVYKKELNYLSDQQKIKIKDKLLLINTDSSREIYKVMLHFLSLDQLKILKFNLIGQNSNNIELPLKT